MSDLIDVRVPDIGDFQGVPVIDIPVKVGDRVKAEDSLVTLESDKATMDVPSPVDGEIVEITVKLGDKIAEGVVVARIRAGEAEKIGAAQVGAVTDGNPRGSSTVSAPAVIPAADLTVPVATVAATSAAPVAIPSSADGRIAPLQELTGAPPRLRMPSPVDYAQGDLGDTAAHASPSVRAFARELGADIRKVKGSGPKGRITQTDVSAFVKSVMSGQTGGPLSAVSPAPTSGPGVGLDLLPWPKVDFAKFGPVDASPLSRIKKISRANLWRNWVMIPHVTQFDEADITDLEAFRVTMNKENEKGGAAKLTMLAFLIKASVAALKKFPEFNASLDGDNLVLKNYYHIGFAADTPNGLVVPVLKNADQKGVIQIAQEMGELAKKAREGKLGPADMQGGCFTISSLGGIGGTAFTPIINAPELAILGVSKTQIKPVWDGTQFVPRQMLPLSLSYDHRVIDGASAARFTTYLASVLLDMRRVML